MARWSESTQVWGVDVFFIPSAFRLTIMTFIWAGGFIPNNPLLTESLRRTSLYVLRAALGADLS